MKKVFRLVLFLVLLAALVFIMKARLDGTGGLSWELSSLTASPATPSPTADALSADAAPEPTPTPTPEPTPEYFTISCIGDCTLWSSAQFEQANSGLPLTVGDNLA